MARVLVTRHLPAGGLDPLLAAGHDVVQREDDAPLGPEELQAAVAGVDAVVCLLTDRIDAAVLDAGAGRLRVVANVAVGYDNIDVAAARARGIIVTNTPDVLTDSVADFTMALMLALTRRVAEGDRLVRAGQWRGWALDFMLGRELRGRVLGIVGFGRIGRAVASRALAFGMRVMVARPPAPLRNENVPPDVTEVMFHDLLAAADIVTLHVPLTPATRHLIGAPELSAMKRGAVLVNTARGPVVDEAALVAALRDGHLAGAALDVFEREPLVHPDLLTLEQVVLTPHLGSATVETRTAMADLAVSNVLAVLAGQPPLTPV